MKFFLVDVFRIILYNMLYIVYCVLFAGKVIIHHIFQEITNEFVHNYNELI